MKKSFTQFLKEGINAKPGSSGRFFTIQERRSAGKRAALADKLGVTFRELNTMSDEELISIINNIGEHDFVPDDKFDPKELARGVEVEREHTQSNLVAKLVAKDHLAEIPDYYTRLDRMEAEGERAARRHK